jgi:hypothetical protein
MSTLIFSYLKSIIGEAKTKITILRNKKYTIKHFFVLDLTFRYNITSRRMLITKCSYHLIFLDPTLKTHIEHSHIKLWTKKLCTRKANIPFKKIVCLLLREIVNIVVEMEIRIVSTCSTGPLFCADLYYNCYVLQLPMACEQYRMICIGHSANVAARAPSDLKVEIGRLP